jgi:arsenate reductase
MRGPRTVLFVCLHGAAKSVLAAADCERLAVARGLPLRAACAGTAPEPAIAPAVLRALLDEGMDLRGQRPRPVTPEDLAAAWRVVAFGCDPGALLAPGSPAASRIERWDDVPAVSEDLPAARAAIGARLLRLLDECARAERADAP